MRIVYQMYMDLKIENIFTTKRNNLCILIENNVFSESNHLKNGSFRFRLWRYQICQNKREID